MSNFFSDKVLKEIKKFESETVIKKKILSENECKKLLEHFRNLKTNRLAKANLLIEKKALKFFLIFINQNL